MSNRLENRAGWLAAIAAAALFVVSGCEKKDKFLRIDPPSFEIEADTRSMTARIEASASWMSYVNSEWLVAFQDEDDPSILYIEIPEGMENNSLEPREVKIDIITGDAQNATIRVLQRALDAQLSVSPSGLQEFDGKGTQTKTLAITTKNIESWAFANAGEWLTVTRGEGAEENILTVRAAYSNNLDARRDTIVVYPETEGFEALNDSIPVVQAGVHLVLRNADMEETSLETGPETAEIDYILASTHDWTVSADNGASLSSTEGNAGTQGETFTVTIPANETAETVTYTVAFLCNGEEYKFTIIQAAGNESGNQEPQP